MCGSRLEPVASYCGGMETRCHWYYTHPAWGGLITKESFNETDARRLLPDAERVEGTDFVVPASSKMGHTFASGLVRRSDGPMMAPTQRG